MNSKLHHNDDWPELARQAKWSASTLAKICRLSVRTLERHFLTHMGKCPKKWLTEQRHNLAHELLDHGNTIKEVASQVGYQHASTFSREYKRHWGEPPIKQAADSQPTQATSVV